MYAFDEWPCIAIVEIIEYHSDGAMWCGILDSVIKSYMFSAIQKKCENGVKTVCPTIKKHKSQHFLKQIKRRYLSLHQHL